MITVYWRPGCPFCFRLKVALRLARIPFRAVDIRTDPDAAAVVRRVNHGDELVPTVRVHDRFLSNPTLAQVKTALAAVR